jgi:EAL domain-containing protein (putative c-di-GMP-specific phosphodiesterase class I)
MQSEAEALKALGCKYAQGYLYGKAMPPEDLAAFIRDHG